MTGHPHDFSAIYECTFSTPHDDCDHCGKKEDQHVDGKCLFEATNFQRNKLVTFFKEFLRAGGTISLETSDQKRVLTQKIYATSLTRSADLRSQLQTRGPAYLKEL